VAIVSPKQDDMDRKTLEAVIGDLLSEAQEVRTSKGRDYTKGLEDVFTNFKGSSASFGMRPEQILGIFMDKHVSAVYAYIKSGGQSESEPIKMRIIDCINYLCLLHGMILEKNQTIMME